MEVLRSQLFVPGNNMRQIQKMNELNADAYILDLEDSVPMDEKETARIFIRDSIDIAKTDSSLAYVRVNGVDTGLFEDDLEYVMGQALNGIMLPMIETADDVLKAIDIMSEYSDGELDVDIMPTIETPKGVEKAYEICNCSDKIVGIGFGAVDFSTCMGIELSESREELSYPRAKIAISALAADVLPFDTVFGDIADKEGFEKDCKAAKQLGYKGKYVIHPMQIETVNEIFSPSREQVEWASKVVKEFEKALDEGRGAISLEGEMIDKPVYERAKDIVEFSEAIEEE